MTGCVVCEKLKEKKAIIIYEDENLVAILPSKPAVIGHIKVMPKQHAAKLEELPDNVVEELFFLSNFASSSIFDAVKAHGTNIILNEGDNPETHLCLDVMPRKEGDGLNFRWKTKQLSVDEMDDAYFKIKDKAFFVGRKEVEQKQPSQSLPSTSPKPIIISDKSTDIKSEKPEEKKEEDKSKNKIGEDKKEDDEVVRIPNEDKTNYLIKQLQRIP